MRGWDTVMSSTCVQSGGVLPRMMGGGAGYEPLLEARSPAPAWHHIQHNMAVNVKQEPLDHDSSAYGSGSDGFHSSSPGGSDHHSRDSEPLSKPEPGNFYTPVRSPAYQAVVSSFDPLTPPGFEPAHSPKGQADKGFRPTRDATLTPCTTPPKSAEGEDHLRRLQMAFEKNGLLPESATVDGRDSGDDDPDCDELDEQGLRVPRVNAHGKVKTFKCKQCDFIAVTKLDFWEHSRAHIKAEKLLTCPKCPFVTEYKHHLEYHLRNHFGSKPFKCDKCSYSCVNKSMLNSHLKSHSNVYQYRCNDCTYATKYCHSLKLHLRKYKHNPAMVLNPDGTPNPLPIIDVYGTRRGPKQKNAKEDFAPQTPQPVPQSPPMFQHFMVNKQLPIPFPYPLLGAFPMGSPLMFPPVGGDLSPNPSNERSSPDSLKDARDESPPPPPPPPEEEEEEEEESSALDLTKPEAQPEPHPAVVSAKSRRKGRAFKLERMPVEEQPSSDEEDKKMEVAEEPKEDKKTEIFNCQYCDIDFRDVVMYTMHMGYHGYKDPFTCNMCGEQSLDKVSFFLHIARTSHS